MSYEKVKAITLKENKIYITSSCSNDTEPYKKWEFKGDEIDLLINIINGNLHLNDSLHKWDYIYNQIEKYYSNINPEVFKWTISNEERRNILINDNDFMRYYKELLNIKLNKNYIIKLERYKTLYITKINKRNFNYSYNREEAKIFNMFEIEAYKNKSNDFIVEEV